MFRYARHLVVVCGFLAVLSLSAGEAKGMRRRPDDLEERLAKTRILLSAGYNSTGVVNFLTFREGKAEDGWNWQLVAAYPMERPFFIEGGLMGWTLGREGRRGARRFGVTVGLGLCLPDGMSEIGVGVIPSGGHIFVRRFLSEDTRRQAPFLHGGLVFPTLNGTRTFLQVGLGYVF